jgi:hypothetical protein
MYNINMSKVPENLSDLAASAGPTPEGVALTTWLIAKLDPKALSKSARYYTPSYEDLINDRDNNDGRLLRHMQENPMPEASLGSDIMVKQQELSKTRRRMATVACTLALFAGGTAYGYETLTDIDKDMKINTTTVDRLERGSIIGGATGALGGFVTMFVALGQSGRLARGPARKIVKQAKQESQG